MADKGLTLTQKRIQNNKIFVYACLALSLALDIAVFVMLVAYALPVKYWIVSILFALFDFGFLVISLVSNFRFGYFRPHLVFYGIALTALSVVAVVVGIDSGSGTPYTTLALIAYPIMHFVTVVTVIIAVAFSVKSGNKSKIGGLVVAVFMLAASAMYTVHLVGNGYFGQPLEENRALLYSYSESFDGYAVVGVEKGSGTKIVIPDEFNGKKVYAVDCSVFSAEGITKAELNCATNVIFDNEEELNNISDSLTMYVNKQDYDTVRNRFYAFGHERAVKCMAPGSLDKDEVFVSFAFPTESDSGKLYPTWYGKKGDTLSLGDDAPEWYKHFDLTNDDDLYYALSQNDANIFIGFYDNGSNVDRQAVSKSYQNLVPKFDKVYGLIIDNGNDDAFTMPQWFKYSRVNGEYHPYRYVALSTADSFLETAPTRTGFSLMWKGNFGMFSNSLSSLSEYLNACSGNGATVIPVWNLDAPTVSDITGNNRLTYGDTLTLSVTASHAISDIDFEYHWYRDQERIEGQTESTLRKENIGTFEGGSYWVEVKAYSKNNAVTSLSSTAEVHNQSTVSVFYRNLHFTWNVPETQQYNAKEVTVTATYDDSEVINDDEITFTQSFDSLKNAGVYNLSVTLTGDCKFKYSALGEQRFSITAVPLTITVNDVEKTYDGENFSREDFSNKVEGLISPDKLEDPFYWSVSLTTPNVGTYDDITVRFSDESILKNYNVTRKNGTARITKREATVVWDENTTSFTYTGDAQHPTVQSIDVVELDRDTYLNNLTYSGASVNAGTGYTAGVSFRSGSVFAGNYTLSGNTCEYSITAKDITLAWESVTTFTYNGAEQYPKVSTADVVYNDRNTFLSFIEYTGKQVNAGQNHSVSASFREGSVYRTNYRIVGGQSCSYVINPKNVTLVWGCNGMSYAGGFSFRYDGSTKTPMVTDISGAVQSEKDTLINEKISYSGTNGTSLKDVGRTEVNATLDSDNYVVTGNTEKAVLQIYAKDLQLIWSTVHFTYDGQSHTATVVSSVGAVPGEESELLEKITYSGDPITNVGTTQITASLNNANYNAAPLTVIVTVSSATVRLVWGTTSFIYNGEKQVPEVVSVEGAIGNDGEAVKRNITVSIGINDTGIEVGSHSASASLSASPDSATVKNYTLDISTITCSYRIEKKGLTLEWQVGEYTYDGSKQIPTLGIKSGLTSRDNAENILSHIEVSITSGDGISAGSHTVTATAKLTLINYQIDEGATCTYTIERAPLTITWCGPYFIYNGEKHLPALMSMDEGVPGGERVSMSDVDIVLTSGDGISAGSHTAKAVLNERIKNYVLTGSNLSITYDIEKRLITLDWEYNGVVDFLPTGSPREVVPTNKNLPEGVRLVATYYNLDVNPETPLQGAPSEPGKYKVVYTLDGEKASNYEIENPEKMFNIKGLEE
ncbi:MAG: bacterial Ig-like domain-containing protein [Clostridiales bacterium]|nr:bacterial Ig-like domain-containing protein [Clostridiales bacterium]